MATVRILDGIGCRGRSGGDPSQAALEAFLPWIAASFLVFQFRILEPTLSAATVEVAVFYTRGAVQMLCHLGIFSEKFSAWKEVGSVLWPFSAQFILRFSQRFREFDLTNSGADIKMLP